MVDSDTALTSAHCIVDANGDPTGITGARVCTNGNRGDSLSTPAPICRAVTFFEPGPNVTDNTPAWEDDFALVHLSSSLGVDWMALSNASDSILEDAIAYETGYPVYTWYSSACKDMRVSGSVSGTTGTMMTTQAGDLTNATASTIRTDLDSGKGQSGSPIYYFPGGGSSGAHYVTGLNSGYKEWVINAYTGGPKASAIRTWVISSM